MGKITVVDIVLRLLGAVIVGFMLIGSKNILMCQNENDCS